MWLAKSHLWSCRHGIPYGQHLRAYTMKMPIHWINLYDEMVWVRVFTALLHIWYTRGYFTIMIQVTRVHRAFFGVLFFSPSKIVQNALAQGFLLSSITSSVSLNRVFVVSCYLDSNRTFPLAAGRWHVSSSHALESPSFSLFKIRGGSRYFWLLWSLSGCLWQVLFCWSLFRVPWPAFSLHSCRESPPRMHHY